MFENGGGFTLIFTVYTCIAFLGAIVVHFIAAPHLQAEASIALLFGAAAAGGAGGDKEQLRQKPQQQQQQHSVLAEVDAGVRGTLRLLVSSPRCALMVFSNASFGFAAAFIASYVNGTIVKESLGDSAINNLGAITSAVAALASMPLVRVWISLDLDETAQCLCNPHTPARFSLSMYIVCNQSHFPHTKCQFRTGGACLAVSTGGLHTILRRFVEVLLLKNVRGLRQVS